MPHAAASGAYTRTAGRSLKWPAVGEYPIQTRPARRFPAVHRSIAGKLSFVPKPRVFFRIRDAYVFGVMGITL